MFRQKQPLLLLHFLIKHPHTMMIARAPGEYFVGDKLVFSGAEFVMHNIEEVFPPHGGYQTIFLFLELSFKDQFDLAGLSVGLHFKTDLLFFFTIDMIDLNAEFIALLFYFENTSGHALRGVFYFAFFFIHHPGAGEVGGLGNGSGLNGQDQQDDPDQQGDFRHGSGLSLKIEQLCFAGAQGTVK